MRLNYSGENQLINGFLRAFIAIDVPDGPVKEKILEFQRTVLRTGADLKPVEPENIHITLRFLGDTRIARIEDIKAELNKIQFTPFVITLEGVGVFPDYKHINVVWVGIKEGNIGLVDLYGKINHALESLSIPLDRRGLSPHITVNRVRSGRNREILAKTIVELEGLTFGGFNVNSFDLKQSILTPKGPIYQSLHKYEANLR